MVRVRVSGSSISSSSISSSSFVIFLQTKPNLGGHADFSPYLALRYVLRVRAERPQYAFRVRALVLVVAVVQNVAQLLQLREGLRHCGRGHRSRAMRNKVTAAKRNADLATRRCVTGCRAATESALA